MAGVKFMMENIFFFKNTMFCILAMKEEEFI